jgi:shikimate dehydrogenase
VLGDPVAHSLSPVLHRAGYAEVGLDWSYDAHRVPAGGLAAFVDGLDAQWRGLSLTMPLKREALSLVDRLTDRARLVGAVNTMLLGEGEGGDERVGDNTDLPGAAAAVRERTTMPLASAAILGGGATAASIGLALVDLGVRSVELLVRDETRAGETVEALRSHPSGVEVRTGRLDARDAIIADIVVSTIPADAQSPELVARCGGVPVVFEALYDPWPTALAAAAVDRTLIGGLDLLVHHAALQFELFTGLRAPLEAMRQAGLRALAGRSAG